MAKAVTSTVLAVAEQKGLVSFDTPVRLMTAEGRRRISIRNVVNMEAGLAQAVCYEGIAGSADADCDAGFDRRFAVAMTGGRGRYSYSNMGPQLAADALAMRVRRPFEQVARDLLFVPGGMDEATYEHSRKAKSRVADYERDGKTFGHDFLILPPAGAGLEGSARDLVRFGQLHLTGRSANSRQLLSAGTLARLHSAPNGGFYGFGWGRIGAGKPTELLISDGQVNGGQAMLLINPARGVGALVMSNAAHDEVSELALKAVDTVVPGVSAAFAADVDKAQAAHVAQIRAFLPPAEFKADGFLRVGGHQFPITATGHRDRLIISIAGRLTEQVQSEEDEGFRGWEVPCPSEIPACSRPGAKAKLWLSRDAGALGGQLQVTSLNGQLPYAVRLRLH
jgi:CubicO group peptidase (beta-lactamase class C family)